MEEISGYEEEFDIALKKWSKKLEYDISLLRYLHVELTDFMLFSAKLSYWHSLTGSKVCQIQCFYILILIPL